MATLNNTLAKNTEWLQKMGEQNSTDTESILIKSIVEAKYTIDLFLNNKFEESKARININRQLGIYPQLAHSTLLYIQAMATLEEANITTAVESLKATLEVCNTCRRKSGFTEHLTRRSQSRRSALYSDFTEEHAHAELCYAECLLQIAFLNMLQDEKLSSLIRSSLKIRECYRCYKVCWRILKYRQWSDGISRSAFESGVRMGVGAFNLMISMLPRRVLKLLEFIGFSGDRQFGLNQLRIGSKLNGSLRAPMCALMLLIYDLYATHMLGDTVTMVSEETPDHLVEAYDLLEKWLKRYDNSAIFLLLSARAEQVAGKMDKAIDLYLKAINTKSDWSNYYHVCYWELMWSYALRADWLKAMQYAEKLANESRWSQATYRYMKAAFLLQFMDDMNMHCADTTKSIYTGNSAITSPADDGKMSEHVDSLLADIPKLTHRFAGRSLPIEKIALKKSKRYFLQNKRLTLPALELIFIWNGFKMIQSQPETITTFIMLCENKLNELLKYKAQNENFYDDYCLALMLKGACLRCRRQPFQAKMCFEEIIATKHKLKHDTYLQPFCEMELCQLALEEDDRQAAKKHLEKVTHYKHYSLESRLHFRIHEMHSRLYPRTSKKRSGVDNTLKKAGSDNQLMANLSVNTSAGDQRLSATQSIASLSMQDNSDVELQSVDKAFPEGEEDDEFSPESDID